MHKPLRINRILAASLLLAGTAFGGTDPAVAAGETLDRFSSSVQRLTARVAPSVVQIVVERYGRVQASAQRMSDDDGVRRSIGSGVIVDPAGYIVTNAHVVEDARRIRVRLTRDASGDDGDAVGSTLEQAFAPTQEATLVGMFKEADVALLKIDATGLPALPFADFKKVRQGQIVLAFGSREGLHNSVSLGVISSVARQVDPDNPFIYIQTDAAINPGDSGGPLINTAGEIVGIDTFILSQSGGSEGLGFAIPSPLVQLVSGQIRARGHFHRQLIGLGVQSITPALSSALHLPRTAGVIVTDVLPGSPADTAGVKLRDVVLAVNGAKMSNLPLFTMAMLELGGGSRAELQILRGDTVLSLAVMPVEEAHRSDRLSELIQPDDSEVPRLGVIGITVGEKNRSMFPDLRADTGVYVAARSRISSGSPPALQTGDVIHDVNGAAVNSVQDLRHLSDELPRGRSAALLIEREGKLQYVTFEAD